VKQVGIKLVDDLRQDGLAIWPLLCLYGVVVFVDEGPFDDLLLGVALDWRWALERSDEVILLELELNKLLQFFNLEAVAAHQCQGALVL